MGLIDNFGGVASMYMEEKENLQKAEEKRKRTQRATDSGLTKCSETASSSPQCSRSCCFTHG